MWPDEWAKADRRDLYFHLKSYTVSVPMWQNWHNQQGIPALWVFHPCYHVFHEKKKKKTELKSTIAFSPLVALPILTGLAQPEKLQGEPRKDDCPLPITFPTCRYGVKLSCYTFWRIICWKVKKKKIIFSTYSYVSIIRIREVSKLDLTFPGSR